MRRAERYVKKATAETYKNSYHHFFIEQGQEQGGNLYD